MPAGYSGTPLIKKLGIKQCFAILPVNVPSNYWELLGELPEDIRILKVGDDRAADFIHLFAKDGATLHSHFPLLNCKLEKNGMIWVSWIKQSSRLSTDISGSDVRRLGLELGLVDIKICAIDEDWSGLKFVYRKSER